MHRSLPTVLVSALLTGAATAQLVNGGSVGGAITSIGGQDSYSFSAQAGQHVLLRLVDDDATNLYPVIELYDPNGTLVASDGDYDVAGIGHAVATSGTFQVVVRDGNSSPVTGDYTIHFVRTPGANEGGALPIGGSVTGTIARGDLDSYTFAMVAGQNYHLRFADVAFSDIYTRIMLFSPSGALVAQDGDYQVAALAGAAGTTGTYTVVVMDGSSSPKNTGAYALHFVRTPGANEGGALPSGGSVSGTLEVGDLDSFTFPMVAGESYQLRTNDRNASAIYMRTWLYDPNGGLVATDGDYEVSHLEGDAPTSGIYTLVVADGNSSPHRTGDYDVHFVRVPGATSGGALASGTITTGTIDRGELESFTFAVEAGENFLLRAADTNYTNLYIRMVLYDPRGCFVAQDGDYNAAALSGTAGFTGDYTVVLGDGSSSPANPGDFALSFTRVPGATSGGPLANGGIVSGEIAQGEVESFTFDVEAGDRYFLRCNDANATSLYPTVALYDPRGTFVAQDGNYDVCQLSGTAQFSGTYTVALFDGSSSPTNVGAFEVRLVTTPGANEHGYLLDGVAADGTIDRGDLDSFTFLGTAGDTVAITMTDVQLTNLYPSFLCHAPNGQVVLQRGGYDVAAGTFTAPFDGTYTIVAYDGTSGAARVGDYTLQVSGSGVVGNSGCDRLGKVQFAGATSAATGFSVLAPETSQTFSTPAFVALGSPLPQTVLLPNGVTCGACGLDVFNVFALELAPVVIAPLSPATVGTTLTAQGLFLAGPCIELTAASTFTILP